jgi:hypothetical protein
VSPGPCRVAFQINRREGTGGVNVAVHTRQDRLRVGVTTRFTLFREGHARVGGVTGKQTYDSINTFLSPEGRVGKKEAVEGK